MKLRPQSLHATAEGGRPLARDGGGRRVGILGLLPLGYLPCCCWDIWDIYCCRFGIDRRFALHVDVTSPDDYVAVGPVFYLVPEGMWCKKWKAHWWTTVLFMVDRSTI